MNGENGKIKYYPILSNEDVIEDGKVQIFKRKVIGYFAVIENKNGTPIGKNFFKKLDKFYLKNDCICGSMEKVNGNYAII